jgi:aspartate aminotransferase
MTGWRIGYTASNPKLAKAMSNIQSHATSNPNSIAQMASIAALDGGIEPIFPMKKAFEERKDYIVKRINSIDKLSCLNPQGAFYIMVNIKKVFGSEINGRLINTSMDFADVMLEEANVALVPGIAFGAEGYVRMSYATSMEKIAEGLDRIQKIL